MLSNARPPVILQVLPALQAGGVERGTVEIVRAITAAGGKALVASAGGRLAADVERAGGRHVTMPLQTKNPFRIWRNAARLSRLIRKRGRRYRACPIARAGLVGAARGTPTGAAFVTTWHGVYGEDCLSSAATTG